jgi:hypothetical protein
MIGKVNFGLFNGTGLVEAGEVWRRWGVGCVRVSRTTSREESG